MAKEPVQKVLRMGLGEAVQRLIQIDALKSAGLLKSNAELRTERALILAALNTVKLDIGFDCDDDGVPDTMSIFARAAQDSCCRLVDLAPKDAPARRLASPRRR